MKDSGGNVIIRKMAKFLGKSKTRVQKLSNEERKKLTPPVFVPLSSNINSETYQSMIGVLYPTEAEFAKIHFYQDACFACLARFERLGLEHLDYAC